MDGLISPSLLCSGRYCLFQRYPQKVWQRPITRRHDLRFSQARAQALTAGDAKEKLQKKGDGIPNPRPHPRVADSSRAAKQPMLTGH